MEVVDLSQGDEVAARAIRTACIEAGFFYVVNHGIDEALVERVFAESRHFFGLPLEEKKKVLQDKNNRGYTPSREEILDPENQKHGDTKEGYYIGVEVPESDPLARTPLHGPNQWPSEELAPSFRPIMEEYFAAARALSLRLVDLLALALGLDRAFFRRPGTFDRPIALLRLLHYEAAPSDPDAGVLGAGAHSDYGMLTLLAVDGPGLQICRNKDAGAREWEDVGAVAGALVVNLGDMLERWSNGHFRSTLHRVCTPGGGSGGPGRYSFPFFFEPNFDCVVECLPTCCGPADPPKWPPTTSGQHLLDKYRQTHVGFVEQHFAGGTAPAQAPA